MRARNLLYQILLTLVSASASLICFVSNDAFAQQQTMGNIVGEIRVSRMGLPTKQILVNLQTRGETITSSYTEDTGRFGFYNLPGGIYELVIQDDDYQPTSFMVVLKPDVSQISYAIITLELRSPEGKRDDRISGSNRNVIDLAEYSRKFPKDAIKEYQKGQQSNAHGNSGAAIRHFQKAISLAPDFYPAHNELGTLYLANADMDAAKHEFEEVLRLNQSDTEASVNLANTFLLTKQFDEALKNVQEALRRDPNSALGRFVLGSIYERTGKPVDAERALHQALELDPMMSKVHLELVNLYLSQKRKPEAIGQLETFLRHFPNDPMAPQAKEVLKKLSQ